MNSSQNYNDHFYEKLDQTSSPAAFKILPIVFEWIKPAKVVDIGCGDGSWLKVAETLGAIEIFGIDGPWIKDDCQKLRPDQFARFNLSVSFAEIINKPEFDLAISLEVAEHLPPDGAAAFVAQLAHLAPVVLFSAAIPGQGGSGHINEQPPEYWAKLFDVHGYVPIDTLRWKFWEAADIAWWYRQNILLFVRRDKLENMPEMIQHAQQTIRPLPHIVHPDRFAYEQKFSNPNLSRWLKMFPAAIRKQIKPLSARAG